MLARPASAAANGRILVVKRMLIISGESLVSREMFQHEIRICSGLNHPNIINLYDFGEVDGQPYIAMEYVQGWTLRTIARRFAAVKRPIPVPLSTLVIAQAAGALHYAHTFKDPASGEPLNIIHRDISPQNIMMATSGNVKVIDFGIAKTAIDTARTETGVIKGKVSYLSPEQADQAPLSPVTDVFSLGLILWELLTGRKYFDPHQAGSDLAVLERVLEHVGAEIPPSAHNPGVPPELDRIVIKALAARPCDRHASADALRRELHEVLVTKYAGFSTAEAAEMLAPLFAETTARDENSLRQLNTMAQEKLERDEERAAAKGIKEEKPHKELEAPSRSFSFLDLPELSERVDSAVIPDVSPARASELKPPAPYKPPGVDRSAREFKIDASQKDVKVSLDPAPQVHLRQQRPAQRPNYSSAPRPMAPVYHQYEETMGSRIASLLEHRWPSILVAMTVVLAFGLHHASAKRHAEEKVVQRAPTEAVAEPTENKTATLRLLIEPYRYSALARVYVNDEEVLPEGDAIKVPLDRKVSLRIERPAFFPYLNEFTLSSAQMRPPGVFKLHVNLVAKPAGHHG